MVGVEYSGLEEQLDRLGLAIASTRKLSSQLVRRTALLVQRDAQLLAPVDTGFLRSSITVTFEGGSRSNVSAAEIGPTASYGVYLELGTSTQPPQPYLAPAFERHEAEFHAACVALVSREVL